MEILNISSLGNGYSFVGIALIKSAQVSKTKNGNDYISGVFSDQSVQAYFKVWDGTLVEYFKSAITAGFTPTLAVVQGTVGTYNGKLDYTFSSVEFNAPIIAQMGVQKEAFLPSLNTNALYKEFVDFINQKLSHNWIGILTGIFATPISVFDGSVVDASTPTLTLNDLVASTYAATSHHDNIRGGLLNHTLKMLHYAEVLCNQGDNLFSQNKDLIYTGIILHDIGKIQELRDGAYCKNSFVSHRLFGCEWLAMLKPQIVASVGIDSYYRLTSIILEHHDEWGTPCSTVWSKVIHMIDNLDAFSTSVAECFSRDELSVSSSGEKFYSYDGKRLYV